MRPIVAASLLVVLSPVASLAAQGRDADLAAFTTALDSLATAFRLPAYSAVIVSEGEVVWRRGWGFANLEGRIPATPDTPYRLASVTKPITATILMQLVERDSLDLDAPMHRFAIHPWFAPDAGSWAHFPERYADGRITVRHVLTHTSQADPPGSAYRYDGNIFGDLTWVVESVTRRSFPQVLQDRVLDPLGMSRSAPGHLVPWRRDVTGAVATPYAVDSAGMTPRTYPGFGLEPDADPGPLEPAFRLPPSTDSARRALLGAHYTPLHSAQAAAGMIASAEDLARFDIAFDKGRLLSASGREAMFTRPKAPDGSALRYALGWFVETLHGERIAWHYGWFPPTVSALYLKLPDRGLTFILLSNSDRLSAEMSWTARGIRASPFARLFLERIAAIAP